jgi:DNA polymerase III epsilon subunit-like protein
VLQKGKKISLKKAAKTFLDIEIQKDKHSALEDAKTTMELYLLLKVRAKLSVSRFRSLNSQKLPETNRKLLENRR